MSDIGKEAAVEPGDHLSSSPEITLGTCSESLKLELSESVGVLSSSLNEKKEEKINCDVHDDEAEGEHSNSVLSKRTHISPSDSDSEEIESKKIKLSEDESQRRKSVQVIKVVNKTSDLDVSVIDLISDKDYSSTVEVTPNGGESLDDEDLFSDSPPSKQNINSQKELPSLNKNQDHCTPVNEQPKSAVSSVEFNERETYSSTPYVLNTKTILNKRSHDNQQNKSESATEDILPNENIYFVQINDVSILKGIKSMSGIGPILQSFSCPRSKFFKGCIGCRPPGIVPISQVLEVDCQKIIKRDRISIAPEATIPHHKDKSDTTTKKKSLRKTKMKGSKLIVSPDKSFSEISSNDSIIHIGLDVFAKWTEGKRGIRYYLGKVTEKDTLEEHKWRILFHDGVEKVLKESELISSESLVPGKYVNVEVEKNCIRRAIIISHPIPNEDNICYSVEFETDDDKSVEQSSLVPVSRLHLDMEQVKEMASELGQFPKDSKIFCCINKVKCKMAKSTTETEDDECSSPSLRKKGRKPRKIDSTRLFRKMNFILTKTNTKHPAYGLDTETDLGEESSSSDDNYDREKMEVDPFNKYEIKSLILKYGGVVLNSFPGENSKFPKKDEELYIVSDKSCRTLNFLYGIAHGVPPISFQWILDSVRGTKKFPIANYLLPLGYSETKGFEIEQGACESRPLFKLLDKLKILVFGKAAEDWKVFLVRLGAKVYSQKTEAVSSLSRHVLNKINVVLMTDDEDNQHVPDILSNITVVSPRGETKLIGKDGYNTSSKKSANIDGKIGSHKFITKFVYEKEEVISAVNNNMDGQRKRSKRVTGYDDLNSLTWKWFQEATSRINISGPLLKEKALEFAKDLSLYDFKASNGWLESFLKRHNIALDKMGGEKGDVSEKVVEEWMDKIHGLCEGYLPKNIFSMGETGLFLNDCSRHKFYTENSDCAGDKKSKVKLTIALCASLTGKKIKPLVIGKDKKPLCFGKLDPRSLPVTYWSNTKAWMTSSYFERWLRDFDLQMQRQERKVLVFLENCPAHPKLPMYQGIIRAMKLKYRRKQLQYMTRKMEEDKNVTSDQLLASINILDTIYSINSAWNEVQASTIQKCFQNCGFGNTDATVVKKEEEDNDESNIPLSMVRLAREVYDCSVKELDELDQNLSTCDSSETDWSKPDLLIIKEEKIDDENNEEEDHIPDVSFNDACNALSIFKQFVISQGNIHMLETVIKLESQITDTSMYESKLTNISDFLD
ncbi:unnamed protein product [Lepeophtheirus salmonis]|uniref:(salmon louse) hypothetical protein n=1 Tax=Lepeophtheirus salmonis TaxID=72036 RepID=A0A7R8CPR9_LEPSM|nr:unnamed protein product [Lepeophtheirus salmonis]CAF2888847.1 unnamed protein product [Lepeophtheirus salmonis]